MRLRTNTKHERLKMGIRMEESFATLALRSTAAPGRRVGSGTGFARAADADAGRFKHQTVSECGLLSASQAVASGPRPNPSVERTSNGGAQLVARQTSATPLAAAHLKR